MSMIEGLGGAAAIEKIATLFAMPALAFVFPLRALSVEPLPEPLSAAALVPVLLEPSCMGIIAAAAFCGFRRLLARYEVIKYVFPIASQLFFYLTLILLLFRALAPFPYLDFWIGIAVVWGFYLHAAWLYEEKIAAQYQKIDRSCRAAAESAAAKLAQRHGDYPCRRGDGGKRFGGA